MNSRIDFGFLKPTVKREPYKTPTASDLKTCPHIQEFEAYDSAYVYFLTQGDEIVYVGFTHILHTRIGQHRNSEKSFDTVLYIETDAVDASILEVILIGLLKPRYNQVGHEMTVTDRAWMLLLKYEIPFSHLIADHPNCGERLRTMIDVAQELPDEELSKEDVRRLVECAGIKEPRKPSHRIATYRDE